MEKHWKNMFLWQISNFKTTFEEKKKNQVQPVLCPMIV